MQATLWGILYLQQKAFMIWIKVLISNKTIAM